MAYLYREEEAIKNLNIKTDYADPSIKKALRVLESGYKTLNTQASSWSAIQALYEEAFMVGATTGPQKIKSKLLFQSLWRIVNKMKPLDWTLNGTGVDEDIERIVTAGISTVMQEGGYLSCLRDKGGVFFKKTLFGDSFIHVGTLGTSQGFPLKYRVGSLSDVYVDPTCTGIRDLTGGNICNELVAIYRYSQDQFFSLYSEMEGKVSNGMIPRQTFSDKQLEKMWEQDNASLPYYEVAHYYNIGQKCYTIFAGPSLTIIDKKEGDDYPFVLGESDAYIPILHHKFIPSSQGFYNYGLGHVLYDLAVNKRKADNMAYAHAEDNIYPFTVMNVGMGNESKFMNKILMAQKQRAAGGKGFILNSVNPMNPNERVMIDTIQTPPISNEWERINGKMDQEVYRSGIQLDSVDRGTSVTATQILAEEENADSFVKQVMEWNASEYEMAVKITIDILKKTISSDDPTPVNISTKIRTGRGEEAVNQVITLGDIAEELRNNHFYVTVNSRSGTTPSNVMRQTEVARAMSVVQPGSPAYYKLVEQFMELNNRDIRAEDLQVSAPTAPINPAQMEQLEPSQTEEVQARPAAQAEPALV